MRDFNYPDIDRETEICTSHKGNRFLAITKDNYLSQLVQDPTRGTAILDLVLTNRPDRTTDVQIGGHLGNGNHKVITFQLSFKIPNFKKAKFSQLREAIGLTNWDKVLKNKNTTTK